ncbi:hypothetical protein HDU76_010817, partial [Blyttiomyces sp. JEL0837]
MFPLKYELHSYIHGESRHVQPAHPFDFNLTKSVLESIFPDPDDPSKDRRCMMFGVVKTNIHGRLQTSMLSDGCTFEVQIERAGKGKKFYALKLSNDGTYFDLTDILASYRKSAHEIATDGGGLKVLVEIKNLNSRYFSRLLDVFILGLERVSVSQMTANLCARTLGMFESNPIYADASKTDHQQLPVPHLPGLLQAAKDKLDLEVLKRQLRDCMVSSSVGQQKSSDDIELGDTTVSFMCPLTLCRIKLPGKGKSCNHVQVFDVEELIVDGWFLKLLEKYPDAQRCVIHADGSDSLEVPKGDSKSPVAAKIVDVESTVVVDDEVVCGAEVMVVGTGAKRKSIEVVNLLDSDDESLQQ